MTTNYERIKNMTAEEMANFYKKTLMNLKKLLVAIVV